jgi:hypothetical protein
MGRLLYGSPPTEIKLDDRVLAHVKVVVLSKLRRGEGFPFTVESEHGSEHTTLWLHPHVPVQFHFEGGRPPSINRAWLEALVQAANSVDGLRIVDEPAAGSPPPHQPVITVDR